MIPNPWDAGTARILTQLGFVALATTSAGVAFSLGRPDGANQVERDEVLANARAIMAATHLPVSADLESGYAQSADEVATTIRLAAEAGLVGSSIEDATGFSDDPIYPLQVAVERVTAAVEAIRAVCSSVGRPVNVLVGGAGPTHSVSTLSACGVRNVLHPEFLARSPFLPILHSTCGFDDPSRTGLPKTMVAQMRLRVEQVVAINQQGRERGSECRLG